MVDAFSGVAFISSSIRKGNSNFLKNKSGNTKFGNEFIDKGLNMSAAQGSRVAFAIAGTIAMLIRENSSEIPTGKVKIGVSLNGDRSLVNSTCGELSYKHTDASFLESPTSETRVHKNYFTVGKVCPKSLYRYSENRTVNEKVLVDTERDYDFFESDTIMLTRDIRFLFHDYEHHKIDKFTTKNYYGCLFYEHLNLNIKSEMDYYSTKFKLHLVKVD